MKTESIDVRSETRMTPKNQRTDKGYNERSSSQLTQTLSGSDMDPQMIQKRDSLLIDRLYQIHNQARVSRGIHQIPYKKFAKEVQARIDRIGYDVVIQMC